jgi:hypothetical protein
MRQSPLRQLQNEFAPTKRSVSPFRQLLLKPHFLQQEIDNQSTKPSVFKLKVVESVGRQTGLVTNARMRYFGCNRRRLLMCQSRRPPAMIRHDANPEDPRDLGLAFAEVQQFLGLMKLRSDLLGRMASSQSHVRFSATLATGPSLP